MQKTIIAAALLLIAPALAAGQTIPNTITNTNSTSPGTSTAIPRVGENVDQATRATERTSRRAARRAGPTTLEQREEEATLHNQRTPKEGDPR